MSDSGETPTCRMLFEGACLAGKGLQDEVYKHFPNGECENEAVSSFSIGPVRDDETLTRLIIHPIHYDVERGEVHPLAFQDATTLDLSVFREEIATDEEIQRAIDAVKSTGQSRVVPQERLVTLVMQATAGRIRELEFDDQPECMCRVYDTGSPLAPAHASVFTPTSARKGSKQRQVRRALLELFNAQRVTPEDYRPLQY
jgi:hypothetical protein